MFKILFQHVANIKMKEIVHIPFFLLSLQNPVFYTFNTSRSGLDTFEVLPCGWWL